MILKLFLQMVDFTTPDCINPRPVQDEQLIGIPSIKMRCTVHTQRRIIGPSASVVCRSSFKTCAPAFLSGNGVAIWLKAERVTSNLRRLTLKRRYQSNLFWKDVTVALMISRFGI